MTLTLIIQEPGEEEDLFSGLHLFEETPRINAARVRPFVYAVLLFRGGVRPEEVVDSIAPHAHPDDKHRWDDASGLERTVKATLDDLTDKKILRLRSDGLYVLSSEPNGTSAAIRAVAALDAALPDHLLAEMGRISLATNV